MAAGSSASARSRSGLSITAAIACANPSQPPVDLWITPTGYPLPHRPNNHSNSYEQNRKTVTHVVGQTCHPCRRLLTGIVPSGRYRERAEGALHAVASVVVAAPL